MSDLAVYRAAVSQARGELGETAARNALAHLGFVDIKKARGRWVVVGWIDKVNMIARVRPDPRQKDWGDWQAIDPTNGRSVRIEVKARSPRLPYSALKNHQAQGLTDHVGWGGLSLLVWVCDCVVYVFDWALLADSFASGQSLKQDYSGPALVLKYDIADGNIVETSTINKDRTPDNTQHCESCNGVVLSEKTDWGLMHVCQSCNVRVKFWRLRRKVVRMGAAAWPFLLQNGWELTDYNKIDDYLSEVYGRGLIYEYRKYEKDRSVITAVYKGLPDEQYK